MLNQLAELVLDENSRNGLLRALETNFTEEGNQQVTTVSNQQLNDFLLLAKENAYLTTEMLSYLNHHREKMADLFGLIDKFNDGTLYKDLNKLEEFWEVMAQQVSLLRDEAMRDEALKWVDEKRAEVEMCRLHEIQNLVWQAENKYGLDVERLHNIYYKKRICCHVCYLCCCCQKIRKCCMAGRIVPKDAERITYGC